MDLPWGFYLGWGWHPVFFFLSLVVSLVLAALLRKRVLWLVPALVLYFGLRWEIPGVWESLFKVFFWLTFVVAFITFVLSALGRAGRTLFAKVPLAMMIGLIVVSLIILWPAQLLMEDPDKDMSAEGIKEDVCETINGKTNKKVQEEVPAGYEADESENCTPIDQDVAPDVDLDTATCPVRFRQDLDRNWRNRFDSDGLRGVSREKRLQTLRNIREDYRYLHAWADVLFNRDIERRDLVNDEKTCLSPEGRRLYDQITGALMASGVRSGQAPANAYNTGMDNGRMVVAATPGIYGDRSATIYTLPNGSKVYVLDRCGNFALAKQPKGTPEGRTDNPRPPRQSAPTPSKSPDSPTTSKPKPTPTLQPKSSDPKDYKVEEGAPKATVTEPASKPSEVKTEQPGGGGVTDSPTNAPGSESGVQAPESEPAPSYSPPPAEEGANDPSDGGTSCVPPPGMTTC